MPRAVRSLPWLIIVRLARSFRYDGLEIRVFEEADEAREVFLKASDALGLIADRDPADYRRIRRHVSRILFMSVSGGLYVPRLRTCVISIDYAKRSTALDVAMMIVHEATHARLWSLGCRYTRSAQDWEERTCVKAEIAFASKISDSAQSIARTQNLLSEPWWTDDAKYLRSADELGRLGCPPWLTRLLLGRRPTKGRPQVCDTSTSLAPRLLAACQR